MGHGAFCFWWGVDREAGAPLLSLLMKETFRHAPTGRGLFGGGLSQGGVRRSGLALGYSLVAPPGLGLSRLVPLRRNLRARGLLLRMTAAMGDER